MKPYLAILPKPDKPLYEKMKLVYRYRIVEVDEAFNLHRHSLTNRTKEITYRLLYNTTPIQIGAKCKFCNEQQTKAHMYGLCRVWKGARLELQRKIKEMATITEWDILKILLINIFPYFGRDTPKIIELVHKYRRLVWELTLKQLHHNAQNTYANLKTICSINIQKRAHSGSRPSLSPNNPADVK